MPSDACCVGHDAEFGRRSAARALRRFRRRGATGPTKRLLDLLTDAVLEGTSHLDIGGGVGALQHGLVARGVDRVVHVDGSQAFLAAANAEALRQAGGARVRRRSLHGDYVVLAEDAGSADIVTLDKVICCYPDMPALVAASAKHARRCYAVVYPRDRWWLRVAARAGRWVLARTSGAEIGYVHAPSAIRAQVATAGLRPWRTASGWMWHVEVYVRPGASSGSGPLQ